MLTPQLSLEQLQPPTSSIVPNLTFATPTGLPLPPPNSSSLPDASSLKPTLGSVAANAQTNSKPSSLKPQDSLTRACQDNPVYGLEELRDYALQAVLQDDFQSLPFEIQSLSLEGGASLKPPSKGAPEGAGTAAIDPLELFNLLPQSVQNDSATAGFQLATQHLTAISSMSYGLLKDRLVHISKAISTASPLERLSFWSRLDYRLQTQYGAGATQGALKFLWRLDTMLTQAKLNANSKLEGYVAASDTEQYRSFRHDFLLESIDKGIAMQGYSSAGFELADPDWGLGLTVGSSVLFVVETGGLGLIMGGEGLMGAGLAFNSARVFGYGMKSVAAGSRLLPSVRVAVVAAGGAAGSRGIGERGPVNRTISIDEKVNIRAIWKDLGGDPRMLRFTYGKSTGYRDATNIVNIGGDIFPGTTGSTHPRSIMSIRAVLAHEMGHVNYRNTILLPNSWNDEFRASYWASKNGSGKGLSDDDVYHLVLDAQLRAQESGVSINLNSYMRKILYGY